jgi:hypothetical protein
MSPKRRAVRDDRWDRTPGGLIVPRRPTLPTRRFIQKWGPAKCCCTDATGGDDCVFCDVDITITVDWPGFSGGSGCGPAAGTYLLSGVLTGSVNQCAQGRIFSGGYDFAVYLYAVSGTHVDWDYGYGDIELIVDCTAYDEYVFYRSTSPLSTNGSFIACEDFESTLELWNYDGSAAGCRDYAPETVTLTGTKIIEW